MRSFVKNYALVIDNQISNFTQVSSSLVDHNMIRFE